jgi:hypothetical protein
MQALWPHWARRVADITSWLCKIVQSAICQPSKVMVIDWRVWTLYAWMCLDELMWLACSWGRNVGYAELEESHVLT